MEYIKLPVDKWVTLEKALHLRNVVESRWKTEDGSMTHVLEAGETGEVMLLEDGCVAVRFPDGQVVKLQSDAVVNGISYRFGAMRCMHPKELEEMYRTGAIEEIVMKRAKEQREDDLLKKEYTPKEVAELYASGRADEFFEKRAEAERRAYSEENLSKVVEEKDDIKSRILNLLESNEEMSAKVVFELGRIYAEV